MRINKETFGALLKHCVMSLINNYSDVNQELVDNLLAFHEKNQFQFLQSQVLTTKGTHSKMAV